MGPNSQWVIKPHAHNIQQRLLNGTRSLINQMVGAPLVFEWASKINYKLCVIGEMFQICNTLGHGVEWKEIVKNSLHIFRWFVIGRNYIFL